MHILPDMVDEDAVTEVFWPDTYKQVIRRDVKGAVLRRLARSSDLERVYAERFADGYDCFESFVDRIADMVVIGAENGADDAFDELGALLVQGGDLRSLQQIMGHADIKTTEKYSTLNLTDIIKKHRKFTPLRAAHAAAQETLFAAEALKEAEQILRRKKA